MKHRHQDHTLSHRDHTPSHRESLPAGLPPGASLPFIAALTLLFTIAALAAPAQDASRLGQLKTSTPEQRAHLQDSLMKSRLSLTDIQYKKVASINLKYAREIEPVIKSDASQFTMYWKVKPLLEAKDKELKAVFTAQQWQKYEAAKKEMIEQGKKAYGITP